MVVGMESGPNGTIVPPGLPPQMFGYGVQPSAAQIACSTGLAVAGINTTAMGALLNTQAGITTGHVLTDLTARLQ